MTDVSYPKLFAAAALWACAGCLGSAVGPGPGGSDAGVDTDGGGTTGGGGTVDMAVDVKGDFDAKVKPLLLGDCGSCHSMASGGVGPGFLSANPDVFTTVINYPGLVGATCETTRILTKDVHVGPSYHASANYTPTADLAAHATVICDWVKEYNANGGLGAATNADLSVKPRIMPWVPAAGNKSIDLGVLDPSLAGATLAFDVTMIGTTQIEFSNITLKATSTVGVHIKSPVFAKYAAADANVALDIDYDFLDKDFTAGPGMTTVFAPSLTFTTYSTGQMVNVSFGTLENSNGAPDMAGAVTGCKDLTAFNALMPNFTTALPGMNNACSAGACHGQNGGTGGLNLNGIAANNAAVCGSVLNNVIVANPATSPLYLHPTDGTTHAGGKITAGTDQMNWLTAVTTFANAEK
jgi:hypothetical protein